ncbi:sulfur carrier protein ThiS [Archangium violaceum]|uniref:sulfur carrier protein ThiS n=1 Tax=Archangium violaceum TaxID=83451 RepID=UPI00193BE051|nr:sulfur carrier protein ThiS [Archangium violaceum]QRK11285.1 sulfur carrier protein ThiS [Archangium violaceum]
MKIIVNGETRETASETLGALLLELGHGEAKVATAVNEAFVPATARDGLRLTAGDRVEIVTPRQGG